MSPDAEKLFQMVLRVFREYLLDCDADIEGCDADQLTETEHCADSAHMVRSRIVREATEIFGGIPAEVVNDGLDRYSLCP